MKLCLHAIVNKNNSMKFQAKIKKVFDICGIAFDKMTVETYWKEDKLDEYFFRYVINDDFALPLPNWQQMIGQLSEGDIVTDVFESEVSLNLYPYYYEMVENEQLCFINCDIPKKHCIM